MKCSAFLSMFCMGREPAVAMLEGKPACERCRRQGAMQRLDVRPLPTGWVARAMAGRLPMRVTGGAAA